MPNVAALMVLSLAGSPLPSILFAGAPQKKSLIDLATQSFPGMVFWVLVLLVVFSVMCWYIIGYKYFYLRRARSGSDAFLETFWKSRRLDAVYKAAKEMPHSPTATVFIAGYVELSKLQSGIAPVPEAEANAGAGAPMGAMHDRLGDLESVERAMRRAQTEEVTKLERMSAFLATTGSAAPFVGLFGTVWGIMTSFRDITATGSASVTVVAPGIAEALIATAIGLMAAIPAVVAYNLFVQRIRVLASAMETFSSDFLNIIKRHVLK
jgi:biopolymer transport protein TolQ